MSRITGIEWTDATWNPIRGCSRVSEGCRHCYAEGVAYRFSGPGQAYEGLVQLDSAISRENAKRVRRWNGQIKFVEKHLLDPLKWKEPRRIFVNSMSDLFHENVTDEMRDKIFAVMALCPQHTFQVLTKRPERMLSYLSAHGRRQRIYAEATLTANGDFSRFPLHMAHHRSSGTGWWPLPNVWLGVSVENQKAADERIPLLLETPAALRFISAEPLLGPVDLDRIVLKPAKFPERGQPPVSMSSLRGWNGGAWRPDPTPLDWVIVGGESGPGARPIHPDWARILRDQCVAAGVPFFFKQWGEWIDAISASCVTFDDGGKGLPMDAEYRTVGWSGESNAWVDIADDYLSEEDFAPLMYRVGKKAAGHLLDRQEWHQMPEATA